MMGWLNNLQKPRRPRRQIFHFAQDHLADGIYAVIRVSWYAYGQVVGVSEGKIYSTDAEAVMEFRSMIAEALESGADVSALCVESAEDLGLETT